MPRIGSGAHYPGRQRRSLFQAIIMNTTAAPVTTPLLEMRELSLGYQRRQQLAADRVSLSMTGGRTLGLVGASGAGKSSIARAALGLLQPVSGEVLFKGENMHLMNPRQLRSARQCIQMVFQEPSASLSPRRTIGQTLLEPLVHFAIGNAAHRRELVQRTLLTVGLDKSVLGRYPHQFSSGQLQRIAIARALVTNPELLIADEAVASLDVSIQAQILQLLQQLQRDLGIALLFISHDLAVIRQIADEVAVMYRGQLLEQSPADRFFDRPAHPYSKTLLAFARGENPASRGDGQWRLDHSHSAPGNGEKCIFAGFCPEKMAICDTLEPVFSQLDRESHHVSSPHCVKCHLYDEAEPNEN